MKKILFFLLLPLFAFSQEAKIIKLNKNIKDKRGLIKSLIVIDSRPDKNIGTLTDTKKSVALQFENENLKQYIENWFLYDNKTTGNTDMVLIIEDIKSYQENDGDLLSSKLKLKMSSFLKRNDKYYFINRFDNIAIFPSQKAALSQDYFADQIPIHMANFIKSSYNAVISSNPINESQLSNYEDNLNKSYIALYNNPAIKDGVYMSYKKFLNQEPEKDFIITKNKKGEVKKFELNGERVHEEKTFCFVDNGKTMRFIRGGYVEMNKDENGFFIVASRKRLFPEEKVGAATGAMAGGLLGAAIGAALDAGNDPGTIIPFGHPSTTESNVYMDPLTGAYIFKK